MKRPYFILILISFLFALDFSNAQSSSPDKPYGPQPEIGKSLPEFQLSTITHYKASSASLSDFKGKWLLLDFWFINCSSCIASFSKISKIQKELKKELNLVLVGLTKSNAGGKNIQRVYEGMRERQNLEMVSAYDSALFVRWGIWSMPYIIMVDPNGIVKHITDGSDMTAEKIREMVSGNTVKFKEKNSQTPEYDVTTFPGSPDNKLVYRSILTRSNGELTKIIDLWSFTKWSEEYRKDGFMATSVALKKLYRQAYTGKTHWVPGDTLNGMPVYSELIYEAKDTSLFEHDPKLTPPEYRGLYSYNLAVPVHKSNDVKYMMKIMQTELKNVFGFEVTIEVRKMPIWQLAVIDSKVRTKLKTKGGAEYMGDGTGSFAFPSGFTARNIPVSYLLSNATYYIGGPDFSWFYDATGITHNIDIEIKATMTDFNDIQKAFRKNGLEFRRALKEFQVVVIHDPVE